MNCKNSLSDYKVSKIFYDLESLMRKLETVSEAIALMKWSIIHDAL